MDEHDKVPLAVEGCPLSAQQLGLWRLLQAEPGAPYRAQCAVLVTGDVDRAGLEQALHDVVARHEILHTAFRRLPRMKVPLQVTTGRSVIWDETWAEELSIEAALLTPAADRLLAAARSRPQDLEAGSPLRCALLPMPEGGYLLLCDLPALCADHATIELLVDETAAAYAAQRGGLALAAQPLQYADVCDWQAELLQAPEAEFWRREELAGTPALQLPLATRLLGRTAFSPSVIAFPLPDARIGGLAQGLGTTEAAVLLAVWQILLGALCGQEEFLLAVGDDGRSYDDLQRVAGPLAKLLPLPCYLKASLPFATLVQQVQAAMSLANERQEYFGATDTAGDESGSRITVGFELCSEAPYIDVEGARFTFVGRYACSERFDLLLRCRSRGEELTAEFVYDSGRVQRDQAVRWAGHFGCLLESALVAPQAVIADFDPLGAAGRHQLLDEWNDTRAAFPQEHCLHHLIEAQVERTPERIAVVGRIEQLSYRELN
ncbi:MAG TPA: condensation domain-containing protein, partial [Thermoanaerobaculia bacterium]